MLKSRLRLPSARQRAGDRRTPAVRCQTWDQLSLPRRLLVSVPTGNAAGQTTIWPLRADGRVEQSRDEGLSWTVTPLDEALFITAGSLPAAVRA